MGLNLSADEVLSTTRAVRKRLDFDRPVPRTLIEECVDLATQAPTGRNRQRWHFLVVTEDAQRRAVADIFRRALANAPGQPLTRDDVRGTVWTTAQGPLERELAGVLRVPYDKVMLAAFIPLAFTIGTDFRPAKRVPREQVLHWDRW
jgi:hypothetical protein